MREIKSAIQFFAVNGMKGETGTFLTPKELEDEIMQAAANDRPAKLPTENGTIFLCNVKHLVSCNVIAATKKPDIAIVGANDQVFKKESGIQ